MPRNSGTDIVRDYRAALESAGLGHWTMDVAKGRISVDAGCIQIMGHDPSVADFDLPFWTHRLHPDDMPQWLNAAGAILSGADDTLICSIRFRDGAGRLRWISVTGKVSARDLKGNPTRVAGVMRSIAAEKETELRLTDSEEKHRVIFNSGIDPLMIVNRDRVSECNRHAVRMFGFSDERDLVSLPLYKLVRRKQPGGMGAKKALNDAIRAAHADGSSCREMIFTRKDGGEFHAEIIMVSLQYCGEKQLFTVIRDTSMNYLLNQRVKEGADLVRALINTPADPVLLMDVAGTILALNDDMSNRLDVTPETAVGRSVFSYLEHGVAEQRRINIEDVVKNKRQVRFEGAFGGRRFDMIMYPIKNTLGNVERIAVFSRDITEMRRLQQEIMEISELERMRIGQDLHDGLGQKLTGIAFLAQALCDSMVSRGYPETADMKEILANIADSIEQTRRISRGLWSVAMDFHDIVEVLNEFSSEVRDFYGISCHLRTDGVPGINNTAVVNNLYFVCRESVNNSIRHGRADRIEIILRGEETSLLLEILDNGRGTGAPAVDGIGMKIMRYRIDLIGGTFEAVPETVGFRVSVRISKSLL